MSVCPDERTVTIITACMLRNGLPTFALTEVSVTPEEEANGVHYYVAEGQLLERGFEEPFVHFAEREAPPFLFPAVRQHLPHSPAPSLPRSPAPEETACPA